MAKRRCSRTWRGSNWAPAVTRSIHCSNNKTAVAIPIFQTPGANAMQLSKDVRAKMEELKKNFPEGIDYSVVYDPTIFVRHSIEAVIHTLLEAILLVVLVVIVFLQKWRAAMIPLAAVPVSLVGTFSLMLAFGFSINALSLFGLVLAIGIVVDDAIVVVENVERNIANGLSSVRCHQAGDERSDRAHCGHGPGVVRGVYAHRFHQRSYGAVLQAVCADHCHLDIISAFNSLTLSPALVRGAAQGSSRAERLARAGDGSALGWFFNPFNRLFAWAGNKYSAGVGRVLRKGVIALIVYGGLVVLTGWSFEKVPTGFVPTQDKQYLVAFAQLPEGSSLDRTEAVIRRMSDIGLKQPGVECGGGVSRLEHQRFQRGSQPGIVFFTLKPFEERRSAGLSGPAIAAALNQKLGAIKEAFVLAVPPPAVMGLGTIGGFKLYVEDRADLGYDALYKICRA